jgi:MFS family permease
VTGCAASSPWPAYAGFAAFGGFWGTWGAAVPAVRDQAQVSAGELGTALLFVAVGALPAMPLAGRLVDRFGQRTTAVLLASLGLAGILVAATASDLLTLSLGLAVVGASSGAADVAINAAAGAAQQTSGRPVLARAHAIFSAAVVLASLSTGALLAGGAALLIPFALLAVAVAAAALVLDRTAARAAAQPPAPNSASGGAIRATGLLRLLLLLGGLGALGLALENGHQNWSALYLADALDAGPATAAAGPAVFAAVVAVVRWSTGRLGTSRPVAVLTGGSLVAATGTAVLATTSSVATGLLGLALAAAGTAVLFPTLLGVLTAQVPDQTRGTATSVVTTVAYLGFLAGPVYVGLWADAVRLPGAMLALAALGAVLAVLAPLVLHHLSKRSTETGGVRSGPVTEAHSHATPSSRVFR